MKNLKTQYLSIYRLLCFLLAIMIPAFSIAFSYGNPEALSPPLFKEVLAPLGIFLLIGSYKIKWIKNNMQYLMLGLYVIVIIWQLFVLGMNKFNPNNVFGFLVIVSGISVGFESRKLLLGFVIGLFVLITTFMLLSEVIITSRVIFIITVFAILFMAFLVSYRKFKAEEQVVRFTSQLSAKNKEITDSIIYGKRIQEAIFPKKEDIKKYLPESFILYKPKDIVAGDFYWMETISSNSLTEDVSREEEHDVILFAVADCTGHGVPGALVSVVCHNALSRAIHEDGLKNPAEILDKTTELVIDTFKQSDHDLKDGMDIALCAYDRTAGKLLYSGANNPLYIIREGALIEFKPNKQPVGRFTKSEPFTVHEIEVKENDMLYLFSDGYADQFGGERGKKFKYKAFQKLLLKVHDSSPIKQLQEIESVFENWKGEFEQIDDVCLLGIRL